MEWLQGEDLKSRLARGPITVADACDILGGSAPCSRLHDVARRGASNRPVGSELSRRPGGAGGTGHDERDQGDEDVTRAHILHFPAMADQTDPLGAN